MPTRDRKPRRRVKNREGVDAAIEPLLEEARKATPADWDAGLRRRLIRALTQKGMKSEAAAGIVRLINARHKIDKLQEYSSVDYD